MGPSTHASTPYTHHTPITSATMNTGPTSSSTFFRLQGPTTSLQVLSGLRIAAGLGTFIAPALPPTPPPPSPDPQRRPSLLSVSLVPVTSSSASPSVIRPPLSSSVPSSLVSSPPSSTWSL